MGLHIAAVNVGSKNIGKVLEEKYPQVFKGVGKLKGRAVQLHVDPKAKPIAQPIRRPSFSLRSKVEENITKLVDSEIVEPLQGLNPVVAVPKPGGDIRLRINVRRAKEVI